jgi:hypothetical protein
MNGGNGDKVARRFPMCFALRCVTGPPDIARTDSGQTVWISRAEVAFLSKAPADVGNKVVLHIEWPVLLEGEVPLQLTAKAEIVQRSGPLMIARMIQPEFRTRSLQAAARQAMALHPYSTEMSVGRALPAAWESRPTVASAAGG